MSSLPLGQLLLTGVPGKELDADTAARLKKLQPGGFILFGRNIGSPEQVRKLIDDLRDLSDIEPIITVPTQRDINLRSIQPSTVKVTIDIAPTVTDTLGITETNRITDTDTITTTESSGSILPSPTQPRTAWMGAFALIYPILHLIRRRTIIKI